MKQNYTTQVLRTVAAQVCQTIGWQSVTASSLEIMVEILDRYIKEICKTTHDYAELYNRTEANLDDLGLTFRDMGIDMNEILEYVSYVDPIVPAHEVPKYPIPKENHLNFLKPGSKEVLTRPVHIHEHLPPLNPPEDEPLYNSISNEKEIDVVGGIQIDDDGIFKRPNDGGLDGNASKKIKNEEEGRPTREITSVMMTTSGFISPAREGKLPDSKLPYLPPEFTRPVPPPVSSPPFKSSKDSSGLVFNPSTIDKKLEKKLKKKNHEKEKRKEKPIKERHMLGHDPHDIIPMHSPGIPQPPAMMPREANEQQLMAERKKALKELKKKTKAEMMAKKKKEKVPKAPKQTSSFDAGLFDKKFEPFPVIPPALPAQNQSQAMNFLTGAAHSMFQNPMMENVFAHNPIVEGKLITEPDKNKLNIFKKITKPKDEPKPQPVMDFLSPPKFDRFDQPSTSQQVYNDPMKKVHKLPKETTMTRVEDAPINFSMSRSAESSFEELAMPKTPSVPRTPDMKQTPSHEKKEKKERKKREKKVDQPDWNQALQNSFMPDLATQNNPFLQTLQGPGGFMGNLGNFNALRNSFGMQSGNMFNTGAGLLGQQAFGMGQLNPMNQMLQNTYGFPLPGMDMNMLQQASQPPKAPKPKKVKPPKPPAMFKEDDFRLMQGSKFGNLAPLVPQQSLNERFDGHPLMNVDPFPLQHHQQPLISFDQLLKNETKQSAPLKSVSDDKIQTFDLTSSPEPILSPPMVVEPTIAAHVEPATPAAIVQQQVPAVKEKSKEKKKKKDKDKDKDKDDHKKKKKDKKEKKKKKEKRKEKNRASMSTQDSQSTGDTEDTCDNMSTASSVPKLMLKLNSPRPSTPEIHKKMLQRRNEDFDFPSPSSHDANLNREPSPELVRISPLVTRPPKAKPATATFAPPVDPYLHPPQQQNYNYQTQYNYNQPLMDQGGSHSYNAMYHQPQQIYSQPEVYHQHHYKPPSPPPATYIPPQSHVEPEEVWSISQNKASYVDSDGSTVWICPACGKVDDGTPMIGCDACDAWYHWACVGIKVEPKDDEDWFCRACIARKQSDQMDGKKKKRKKKDKDKRDH